MQSGSVALAEAKIIVEGDYEYLPLGQYVVAAVGVCGGRPTIKGHRLDARHVQALLSRGDSAQTIAGRFSIPLAAVAEVERLASQFDYEKAYV
jgi:uncharacterized protein (DUF433 family)